MEFSLLNWFHGNFAKIFWNESNLFLNKTFREVSGFSHKLISQNISLVAIINISDRGESLFIRQSVPKRKESLQIAIAVCTGKRFDEKKNIFFFFLNCLTKVWIWDNDLTEKYLFLKNGLDFYITSITSNTSLTHFGFFFSRSQIQQSMKMWQPLWLEEWCWKKQLRW